MTVTVEVWDSANATQVADLTPPEDDAEAPIEATVKWSENSEGTGSITVHGDHPDAWQLSPRRVVRLVEDGDTLGSFYIRRRRSVEVDDKEEDGRRITVTGPGLLARLDNDAVVESWVGAGNRPSSRTRLFNWMTKPPAVSDPIYAQDRVPTIVPTDDRPACWLEPYSAWIWGSPDATEHPAGPCYFWREFTLTEPGLFVPYHSFDDEVILGLDGVELHTQDNSAAWDNWQWTWRAPTQLPATSRVLEPGGPHLLAAKVTNGSAEGPGGFLCAGWIAQEGGGVRELVLITGEPGASGPGSETIGDWKCLAYPDPVPGWTAGEIVLRLISEAQDRGALTGWTCTFDADVDSDGNPWPTIPEFAVQVGSTVGRAIQALTETWTDVDCSDEGLVLHAWDKTAGRPSAAGDPIVAGESVTQLVREAWV